jgi:hypothetical protein
MPKNSISMFSNTLDIVNVDEASGFRWLSASTMT